MFLSYPIVPSFSLIAFGLKCNSCSSSISFEDCFNQRQTVGVHCDEDYKCGKSHYKYKGKDVYSLSCVSITHCNSPSDMCHANQQMSDCDVTCCGKDLCNATSILVASVFSVLVCLVGTFIMCLEMRWWQSFASLRVNTVCFGKNWATQHFCGRSFNVRTTTLTSTLVSPGVLWFQEFEETIAPSSLADRCVVRCAVGNTLPNALQRGRLGQGRKILINLFSHEGFLTLFNNSKSVLQTRCN